MIPPLLNEFHVDRDSYPIDVGIQIHSGNLGIGDLTKIPQILDIEF
jgi:hypothetical protein